MTEDISKPCLVKTTQGFSVTYKNRPLYSKYNPSKNILETINRTEILSGTLILCISPVLEYGIAELHSKLPENCLMVRLELEKELEKSEESFYSDKIKNLKNFIMLNASEIPSFINKLNTSGSPHRGIFKRVLRLDFSGGSFFNSELYDKISDAFQNVISSFWKNRITLVKFGRNYSKNLFKNLKSIKNSIWIKTLKKTVEKPVLVLGAGESLEEILSINPSELKKFFIIAVDASLSALHARNIIPDAFITEESQSVISNAFTGLKNASSLRFISLSANGNCSCKAAENTVFYMTEYDENPFLEKISKNLDFLETIPALGSVGLSAVWLSLYLRKDESVPVFVSGLDFSFSKGKTHGNGTYPVILREKNISRFSSMFSPSAFSQGTSVLEGKNGKVYTTVNLHGYAELFSGLFKNTENLFDAGSSGLFIMNKRRPVKDFLQTEKSLKKISIKKIPVSAGQVLQTEVFLRSEKSALIELKNILSGGLKLTESQRKSRIAELLKERDYLFLHFPDGIKERDDISFLKRVRTEIDFFLKFL